MNSFQDGACVYVAVFVVDRVPIELRDAVRKRRDLAGGGLPGCTSMYVFVNNAWVTEGS